MSFSVHKYIALWIFTQGLTYIENIESYQCPRIPLCPLSCPWRCSSLDLQLCRFVFLVSYFKLELDGIMHSVPFCAWHLLLSSRFEVNPRGFLRRRVFDPVSIPQLIHVSVSSLRRYEQCCCHVPSVRFGGHPHTPLWGGGLGVALSCNSRSCTAFASFSHYSSRFPGILQYYLIFNKTSILKEHMVLFSSCPKGNP